MKTGRETARGAAYGADDDKTAGPRDRRDSRSAHLYTLTRTRLIAARDNQAAVHAHLRADGRWQEGADLLHGVCDLGLGGVVLQDPINVAHHHLADLAERALFVAGLVHHRWRERGGTVL